MPEARDALEHEGAGRLREAIAAWTARNRQRPDPAIEQRLVRLRHEAATTVEATPVAPWPRHLADPFPGISGRPPEIGYEQLTADVLGGAVLHHGGLLVRGLVDSDRAKELTQSIDAAFDARERHLEGAPLSETAPWFAPDPAYDAEGPRAAIQRAMNRKFASILAVDSPRGLFEAIDAVEDRRLPEIIAGYLGERPLISVEKTALRRIQPGPAPAWHQDGSFLGDRVRTIDVWIALSHCGSGTDASGLEVLPKRLEHVLQIHDDEARVNIEILAEQVLQAGDGIVPVCPTFEPGDAMLFDELFLHRTMPGLERRRYALEMWTFAPSSYPDSYTPIAL